MTRKQILKLIFTPFILLFFILQGNIFFESNEKILEFLHIGKETAMTIIFIILIILTAKYVINIIKNKSQKNSIDKYLGILFATIGFILMIYNIIYLGAGNERLGSEISNYLRFISKKYPL